MKTHEFFALLKKTQIDEQTAARALGITDKTMGQWHKPEFNEKELSDRYTEALSRLFQEPLIESAVEGLTDEVYAAVRSEIVILWVVRFPQPWQRGPTHYGQRFSVICLKTAQRLQDLSPDAFKRDTRRSASHQFTYEVTENPQDSLTLYPLSTGQPLSLAGEAIADHPAKKHKQTRACLNAANGLSESILNVPIFTGPCAGHIRPLFIISLENKLDAEGKVIEAEPGHVSPQIYTMRDLELVYQVAEKAKKVLLPLLIALRWQPES